MKAVGLVSGGLDSTLAVRLVQEQGLEVIGLHVHTPFLDHFGRKALRNVKKIQEQLNFDLRVHETGPEYLELVRKPRHRYGKNLNPCIDCHIYMLKAAGRIMEEEGAEFVFTGEVLNQRGMSQTRNTLALIAKEAGLEGRLVRPLSAQVLPETEVERRRIIDRTRFLAVTGKQRKVQLDLAQKKGLEYFGAPAGGCLLTNPQFCKRLKDLFQYQEKAGERDCLLLQVGRHFRISPECKLIVPRDADEPGLMRKLAGADDIMILAGRNPEPIGLVCGAWNNLAPEIAAAYAVGPVDVFQARNSRGFCRTGSVSRREKNCFQEYLIK